MGFLTSFPRICSLNMVPHVGFWVPGEGSEVESPMSQVPPQGPGSWIPPWVPGHGSRVKGSGSRIARLVSRSSVPDPGSCFSGEPLKIHQA